jgi:hypothetical protein
MLAAFWEFLVSAGLAWWAALAVFTGLERHSERLFPDFWKKRVDPWFTPQRRKQALIVFAVLAVFIGTFRAWLTEREARTAIEQQVASGEGRLAVKDMLGKFVAEGEKLFPECQQPDQQKCEADVLAWGTKADDFILAAFGAGEQLLFESQAGYVFYGGSVGRNRLDGSIRRLNDLLQRSNAVPIVKDFDMKKFQP